MYPNNKQSEFADAFAAAGMGGNRYPFLYPNPYMPAQFGLQGNSDMGALIAMFAGPLMGAMAGPENFIPQLMPSQHLMDSYAMRNYQREMMESSFSVADAGRGEIAKRVLGLRSAFTDEPITQLTRAQADTASNVLSNPIVKAIAGSIIGPETYEAAMYGSKGDMSALNSAIAKTGFFRTTPTGGGRMNADTLTAYTESMYAHLYEPAGNLSDLEADARKGRGVNPFRNRRIKKAQEKLKDVAGMQDVDIVSDEDVATRMEHMESAPARVSQLYKKYVKNGTAVTTAEQAKELVKYERAVKEAGVLDEGEATIGQIRREAERAPIKRLHGFMGSQVGEIQRELFEQGLLPQSLGDMSAEDRMRTVAGTERDDETMERLARKMAREEMEKDPTFKKMSAEQQNRLVETKVPENVRTLRKTETELGKTARGERGAMSVEELEKQGGMNLLTVDADAKRAGTTIEKYSGALAAVRKLFGDNGNPNAPVPSLIKMLNALTNGSIGQFEPGRVEAELRKMQTLAKETGVGLEQLAEISTNVTNQGRMLGLNDATAIQATNATMAGIKVMREQGAFSTGQFGTKNQAQMTQMLGEDIQRGAASPNAKALAAMVDTYDADPARYAGTELEAAVKAYRDPNSDGVYTDPKTGEQKNIFENVGRYGPLAARAIVAQTAEDVGGAGLSNYDNAFLDPLVEEKATKMGGFLTQKHDMLRDIRAGQYAAANATLKREENKANAINNLDEAEKRRTLALTSEVTSKMVLDTGDMSVEERNKVFADTLETELEQKFKDNGMTDAEAKSRAQALAPVLADPTQVNALARSAGKTISYKTAGRKNLRDVSQEYSKDRPEEIQREDARASARGKQKAAADLGYENTPVQRASDYFAEIHDKGEKFTTSGLMDALMPTIKNEKVAREFLDKLNPGFETLSDMMGDTFVTDAYIDDLAKNDNFAALKKLADPEGKTFTADTKILSGKQLDAARDRVIAEKFKGADGKLDAAKIDEAYAKANLGKGVGLSSEEKLAELKTQEDFILQVDNDVFDKEGAVSEDRLVREARSVSGGHAREGMEQRAENLLKVQAGLFYGNDPEKLRQGVTAAFRSLDIRATDQQIKDMQDFALDTSEEGKKKLDAEIDKLWIDGDKKEQLKSLLTSMQESAKLDPSAIGLTAEDGKMQQTADGVVDKTNIEAQTVVLNASRYVDKDGKPLFSTSERGTAIQQNDDVRAAANKIVDENYSAAGYMYGGNSTPFTDVEVKDAAGKLAQQLGIPIEDATAVMQSIQADRQQNTSGPGISSWFVGDKTPHAEEQKKKADTAARDIIIRDYSDRKSFSEKDMAAATKKVADARGISMEEAQAAVTRELEKKKIRIDPPGSGPKKDRPMSDNKPTTEDVKRAVDAVVGEEGGTAERVGGAKDTGSKPKKKAAETLEAIDAELQAIDEKQKARGHGNKGGRWGPDVRTSDGLTQKEAERKEELLRQKEQIKKSTAVKRDAEKVADAAGIPLEEAREVVMREQGPRKEHVEKTSAKMAPDAPDSRASVRASVAEERRKKYDYARLGVEEKVTPEQREIMDRVASDPTGKKFSAEMTSIFGGRTREAMFTLPDEAAVELFGKFEPEAQKRGLQELKEAQSNTMLTENQRANAGRLHDAISAAHASDKQRGTQVAAAEKTKTVIEEREKESVRQVTGIEFATMSRDEAARLLANPAMQELMGSRAPQESAAQSAFAVNRAASDPIDGLFAGIGLKPAEHESDLVRTVSKKTGELDAAVGALTTDGEQKKRGSVFDDLEQMTRNMAPALAGAASTGQSEPMKISGTLSLNGLQEVLLSARGQQSVPTDGMGPPVIMDPPSMYSNPMAPYKPV